MTEASPLISAHISTSTSRAGIMIQGAAEKINPLQLHQASHRQPYRCPDSAVLQACLDEGDLSHGALITFNHDPVLRFELRRTSAPSERHAAERTAITFPFIRHRRNHSQPFKVVVSNIGYRCISASPGPSKNDPITQFIIWRFQKFDINFARVTPVFPCPG